MVDTFSRVGDTVRSRLTSSPKKQQVNALGTFLMTKHFLLGLPATTHGTLINLTTSGAVSPLPNLSGYLLSKLVAMQLAALVQVEGGDNVTSISVHPGLVLTDMVVEAFQRFALDTPELVGGTVVWLATEKARFLGGKFVNVNWDVEELVERKEQIVNGEDLKITMGGRFGKDQFE